MIFNEENVVLVLTYLLPGFIITKIVTTELLLDNRSTANDIYNYLLYSFINLIVYSSIDKTFIHFARNLMINNDHITIILRTLVTPLVIGILITFCMKKSINFDSSNSKSRYSIKKYLKYRVNRFFTILGLNRKSQIDDAWDWVFYNLYLERESGTEIVIVLNDKTEICGFFGEKSFASFNKTGNQCIFIEEEFLNSPGIDRVGNGRFISGKDIQSIKIPSRKIKVVK